MRRKVLLVLAAVVLLGVAAWAIWGVGSSLQDRAEQNTIFERLRKISTEDVPTDLGTSSNGSEGHSYTENNDSSVAEPEVYSSAAPKDEAQGHDISILQEENSECVGWVSIEGTDIDYPVMWSPNDPDYYLDHSFEKTSNRHGVPFLDSRCNIDTADNLIIYGHHFVEGEMFSTPVTASTKTIPSSRWKQRKESASTGLLLSCVFPGRCTPPSGVSSTACTWMRLSLRKWPRR